MQQIDKVIRIPMDSELFYQTIDCDLSEWWFNWDDLMGNDNVLSFVKGYDIDILTQLENDEADYLAIYSDK